MVYSPRFSFAGWSFSELLSENKGKIRLFVTTTVTAFTQIEFGNPVLSIAAGAIAFFVQESVDYFLSEV